MKTRVLSRKRENRGGAFGSRVGGAANWTGAKGERSEIPGTGAGRGIPLRRENGA